MSDDGTVTLVNVLTGEVWEGLAAAHVREQGMPGDGWVTLESMTQGMWLGLVKELRAEIEKLRWDVDDWKQ